MGWGSNSSVFVWGAHRVGKTTLNNLIAYIFSKTFTAFSTVSTA